MMLVLSGLHPFGLTLDRLPKTFDRKAFEAYWSTQPGAVARRYGQFATAIAPLQIEAARLFAAGRLRRDDASFAALTRTTLADQRHSVAATAQLTATVALPSTRRDALKHFCQRAARQMCVPH